MIYLMSIFKTKNNTAIITPLKTDDNIFSFPVSISYINDTFFNVRLLETISKLNKILINKTIKTSLYSKNVFLILSNVDSFCACCACRICS